VLRLTLLALVLSLASARAADVQVAEPMTVDTRTAPQLSDTEFFAKLETMMSRIEKTIALNRQQISDNPGAPFLPDLYLQLAELMSQRADILYYLEVERAKKRGADLSSAARADVVTRASREAIQVLERTDGDFPSFAKRPRVLLLLAAAYRSIDEKTRFKAVVDRLIKDYGGTVEAAKGRLLLGEQYFDMKGYEDAVEALRPVLDSKYVYERNAARYRTGVCYLSLERFQDGLNKFEQVVSDPELEINAESPQDGSVPRFQEKVNLKREALIDSIRAYTRLHPKGQEALAFYSNLSPNEIYFQEVVEKLAFRYISINEAQVGIRLLRSMSERIREPSKVVKIYLDVLSKLPDSDRYSIEASELEFVV
jgi:tetratricopeptide (TPR) repeat protein